MNPADLERFSQTTLLQAGLDELDAALASSLLVLADTWGVFTHGTKNLRGYLRRVHGGGIRPQARPRLTAEGPAWAIVDGDQALGMVASSYAMGVAIRKARVAGLGYVGLTHTCHFGAAGAYSVMAAREGLLGWAMSNDTPTVTAPGARGPVLGSNPFSFAAPIAGEEPLLLDFATSTVAGGKVFSAAAHGQSIPTGWVVDAEGRPTTDPTVWPHAGTLTPMAGHKGYGLALMIETLSAVATNGPALADVLSWSFADPSLPTGHSAAFLAMDIAALPHGREFSQRMAATVNQIRSLPKAAGAERILVPGQREWEKRRRAWVSGLDMPSDVLDVLRQLATETGIELPSRG